MIPKIIHYCWFGPKPLPQLVKTCIDTWKQHLPDYEFRLWNESNSPMDILFVQQAYKEKKYAFVSDYVRFWALEEYGGIYLDTDMYLINGFDCFLNNEVFFGWETAENNNISCGVIGSVPNHPFIRNIGSYYKKTTFSKDNIVNLVVPRIIGECYRNYIHKEQITIYPFDFFYPFPYEEKENVRNFLKFSTQNTYAIHLWNISWGTFKDKFRDRILYQIRKVWRLIK